jgi:nuclear GTP-binding protein
MHQVVQERPLRRAPCDLQELVSFAAARQAAHMQDGNDHAETTNIDSFFDTSKRAFQREFQKVVEHADVILEILDARDPAGCRVPLVEELVAASGGRKTIVLVLNKIDLVPRPILEGWLRVLRRELPTVAFRASTAMASAGATLGMGECLGSDTLLQLLKNYCRNLNIKTSIRVGVVGYPNVGKSSIINSLSRSKVCRVGATAGITTASQEIHLDKNITLLDSPGIVFARPTDAAGAAALFLRNCLKIEHLDDPIAPVELVMQRTPIELLTKIYGIGEFTGNDVSEFLGLVARKSGKLKKGGIPNIFAAARVVLEDWNRGKIPNYTVPPPIPSDSHATNAISIVSSWAPIFDIDAIERMEVDTVLSNMPIHPPHADPIEISKMPETPSIELSPTSIYSAKIKNRTDYSDSISREEALLNPQHNQLRKKRRKAAQKAVRRAFDQGRSMATTLDNEMFDG